MKASLTRIVLIGFIWTIAWLATARLAAFLLCSQGTTSHTTPEGDYHVNVHVPEPEVVLAAMTSPAFAVPAVILLLLGWILIAFLVVVVRRPRKPTR